MVKRVRHVVQAYFEGRRIVVFSGGGKMGTEGLYEGARVRKPWTCSAA